MCLPQPHSDAYLLSALFYKSIYSISPLAAACKLGEDKFCRNQSLLPGTTSKQDLIIFSCVILQSSGM